MTQHDVRLSRRARSRASPVSSSASISTSGALAQSGAAQAFRPEGGAVRLRAQRLPSGRLPTTPSPCWCKHIEFGQGPFTGLATLVAEEMDADWSKMRAEHAPSNPRVLQEPRVRRAGHRRLDRHRQLLRPDAQGRRRRARHAGSGREPGLERSRGRDHDRARRAAPRGSGKTGRFGEFAEAASRLPVPENPTLKDPSQFRLIGREGAVHKLDTPDKTNGKAQFTIDIHEPGHADRRGGASAALRRQGRSFDAAEALAVPGVVDVKQISSGVAVYAQGTWPAIKGREKLRVTWDESGAEKRGTAQLVEEYRALARTPGAVAGSHGDAEAALARAGKVIEAEYCLPLSRPCADGAARRLPALGRRAGAGALRQPVPDHRAGDDRRGARHSGRARRAGDDAGRRQLRTPRAGFDASLGGTRRGRQGDRSGTPGEAAMDSRGRHPRRLLSRHVPAPAARRRAGRQDRGLDQHRRRPVHHEGHHAGRHDGEGRNRRDLGRRFEGNPLRYRGFPLRSAHHRRAACRCCGGARSATPTPATPSNASSTNCCRPRARIRSPDASR